VFAEFLQPRAGDAAPPGDRGAAYAIDRATWRDTAGRVDLRHGQPRDLALRGDGFFAVETPRASATPAPGGPCWPATAS
jgi:flagellar basal-body rod protein FlgF